MDNTQPLLLSGFRLANPELGRYSSLVGAQFSSNLGLWYYTRLSRAQYGSVSWYGMFHEHICLSYCLCTLDNSTLYFQQPPS
jgi:hypothetical protein